MNTMEMTKIVAGLTSTFLVFLLIKTGAEAIIHGGEGHGDHHENAYVIEVEGADDHGEEEVEVAAVDINELMASADPAAGEANFRQCAACHKVEAGANGTGPYLHGVVGRAVGGASGFGYSGILVEKGAEGVVWDATALSAFLEDPKGWAPGTKMAYRGMRDPEDRANMIAYLDSLDD